jgi:hypothetical protein
MAKGADARNWRRFVEIVAILDYDGIRLSTPRSFAPQLRPTIRQVIEDVAG